ncbi:NAD(P)/FAD-dependent oxidoreductase [Aquihabitans sp. G128]|uniref:FAD-dependent oxidoreductase n=1 Tax=Aquihabitans sp. G128 TaxID=2849779 RepID=UPI001C249B91|nr:FAD/NAD(P)-binding oxidoreductase [Aquihabitans sp. G128]QXC63255.1 NAD(P)/FAD-dependent oxidoreductase [Aquihabitans sp. G128]
MTAPPLDRIVIVGASLAGVTAAKTLRTEGFTGTITLVGDEDHAPYDRPPLSKQVLTGAWDTDRIALPAGADEALDLTWELGVPAAGLDLEAREVRLADGRSLPYDGLVIACGAAPGASPAPRTWPGSSPCAPSTTRWRCGPTWRPARSGWWLSGPASSAPRWRPRAGRATSP